MMVSDQIKTRSVLSNVVQNAVKFTKNGRVDVVCKRIDTGAGAAAQISVRDSGIGISPKEMASIFEQFAVVDEETSTKYGGTGVGLALTRELCRMMGGKIEVESEPGKGSTFTITLPMIADRVEVTTDELHEVIAEADAAYPSWRETHGVTGEDTKVVHA